MLVSPKAGIKRLVDNQRDGAEQTELPYQVRIENFEGPLDLLLHLIKKNEINIYDIPIAMIAQQYLSYIEAMKDLNLTVAGEFLVMAATLLQIKSKMLLPVEESVMHWHASPRSAVGFLMHAASLSRETLGPRINLTMPGVACTVGEQIAALRRVAGEKVVARVKREPDAAIMKIVSGWPTRFDAKRALALGFKVEKTFDEIIRAHVDDELGGKIAA